MGQKSYTGTSGIAVERAVQEGRPPGGRLVSGLSVGGRAERRQIVQIGIQTRGVVTNGHLQCRWLCPLPERTKLDRASVLRQINVEVAEVGEVRIGCTVQLAPPIAV